MAYVTGFFLVFAGMLIGYFLWYRDRSEEEQQKLSLERETEELRASLKMAQNAHAILDERFVRQKGQLNVLQQLCDDWSSSREQSERDRAQLEIEVEDKRRRLEETSSDLQQEKQQRVELEDQIHHLNQQHIEILNQVEQDWRDKYRDVQSSLERREAELKSAANESERLASSLHQSEASVAELRAEMEAKQILLETATKNASGLEQEYVSLESSLKESSDLLKQARSENATIASEKKVAAETLAALRQDYQQLQQECEQLRNATSSMESLQNQVTSLNQSLESSQEQLRKVSKQRDLAMKAEETAVSVSTGLQHRIDNQESTIHRLREKHKDTMESLKQELKSRSELETHLEKQKRDLESRISEQRKQLQLHSTEMRSRFGEMQSDLEQKLRNKSEQIESLAQQRDQLNASLEQSREALTAAQDEIASLRRDSQRLQAHAAALQNRVQTLGQLESQVVERDEIIKTQAAQIEAFGRQQSEQESTTVAERKKVTQLEKALQEVRIEFAATGQKVFELEAQHQKNQKTLQQLQAEKSTYQQQVDSIAKKLRASEDTIRTLRRERAAVLARLANYRTLAESDATVISFTQAMEQKKRGNYDQEYGGHVRHDERRGTIYTSAPETKDDLKLIYGIAEVLEARLNDFGIYTFKQIMEWKDESVAEFSRLLAFRDRIQRDEWQKQARLLYEKKRGKAAA